MADTKPGRLLVADDNKVNRMLIVRALEQQGHSVATVENGLQAIQMLSTEMFDLLLLDIEMPVMDGFQALEEIFKDPDLRNIPVIMVSAMDEIDGVVKCIEMGAEDYLTKPPNHVLLRARVNASLEKKRLRDEQRKLFKTFATTEVADELLAKGFSLGGKLTTASAMFSDIRGFTTIAESQSPADTIELLNDYYALMFEAINSHSGIVNQMQGDGLMAIFGAPIFYENHRERAVLAALDMQNSVIEFNKVRVAKNKKPIQIGIGIASGDVIAGYAGTQARATYTCIGDTVNLAARLEAYTKEAKKYILIDETTQQGLSPEIKVESLGGVIFKGKTHSVNTFAVIS